MTIASERSRRFSIPLLEIAAFAMIIAAVIIFLTQLSRFSLADRGLPFGMELGGVPVGGQTPEQAVAQVEQIYGQQAILHYPVTCEAGQAAPCEAESVALEYQLTCPEGEWVNCEALIPLAPVEIGLRVNSDAMLSEAQGKRNPGSFWSRFWDYLWRRPSSQISVDVQLEYSEDLLRAKLEEIATRFDSPPQPARPVLGDFSFQPGAPGYTLDVDASLSVIDEALRRPVDRSADLVIEQSAAPGPDLQALRGLLVAYLTQPELHEMISRALAQTDFTILSSIFVIDLQTGEEMFLSMDFGNPEPVFYDYDIAYSAASVVKIAIMAELFRYIDWTPSDDERQMLDGAMTQSSNFHANLMIAEIGDGSPTRGLEIFNESMQYLGLSNTFVGIEYDIEEDGPYISTEARECARQGECVRPNPDFNRQTTARDMGTLLNMIYQCAETGGGGLMIAYPGEFTQTECQTMIDVMNRNVEAHLILAGVPEGTPVAHKHAWIDDTFADAGIVQSPGGDYVLVMQMWADAPRLPPVEVAFPIMKAISQATFNYFNPDLINEPRLGTPFEQMEEVEEE